VRSAHSRITFTAPARRGGGADDGADVLATPAAAAAARGGEEGGGGGEGWGHGRATPRPPAGALRRGPQARAEPADVPTTALSSSAMAPLRTASSAPGHLGRRSSSMPSREAYDRRRATPLRRGDAGDRGACARTRALVTAAGTRLTVPSQCGDRRGDVWRSRTPHRRRRPERAASFAPAQELFARELGLQSAGQSARPMTTLVVHRPRNRGEAIRTHAPEGWRGQST